MSESGWRAVAGEEFSVRDSVGGTRGLVESAAPGVAFVVAYLAAGGFRIPTLVACSVVVVMVATRLIQRTPVTQALGGVFGVGLGALWAWRFGEPGEYFGPGFYINAATLAALLLSIALLDLVLVRDDLHGRAVE